MRRNLIAVVALAAYIGLSGQRPLDANYCSDFTQTPERQIRGCTELINAGRDRMLGYMNRGAGHLRKGEIDAAKKDFATALAISGDVSGNARGRAIRANNHCLLLAILSIDLDMALVDCAEALKQYPSDTNFHDTRGLLFIRLGRFQEALEDFDFGLKRNMDIQTGAGYRNARNYSLYGRGIAKLKLVDSSGNDDIAAAEKLKPGTTLEYSLYGIKP